MDVTTLMDSSYFKEPYDNMPSARLECEICKSKITCNKVDLYFATGTRIWQRRTGVVLCSECGHASVGTGAIFVDPLNNSAIPTYESIKYSYESSLVCRRHGISIEEYLHGKKQAL